MTPGSTRRWIPGIALLLVLAGPMAIARLRAQTLNHISGLIVDASSGSVPGALVTVVNEDTGFRRVAQSRPDGAYAVAPLEAGVYKITVRKAGFRTSIRFGVRLGRAQPARVDFKLIVGSVQETVTVAGSAPLLDSEDAAVSTQVGREEIERLPLNGGGLLSLLELAPGVVITPATRGEAGQFSSGGQRPNTNVFTVDGLSANSGVSAGGSPAQSTGASLPGMTAFGSLDGLVTHDALEEMRIQTSTAVPEFGRLPGAQIALKTRSGANELHGSASYRFRNERLDANDWFSNRHGDPRAATRLNDPAATLGGPLRRDRTFFFLSYEGMRIAQPFVSRQAVPSDASRENAAAWVQPVLNLFPRPNGAALPGGLAEWTGRFSRPARLDSGSARLDQAVTTRLTAFARYSESPSATEFGATPVNLLDLRSRAIAAGATFRARPDLLFDWRVSLSRAAVDSLWRPADPHVPPACFQFTEASPCDYLARLSIAGAGQVVEGAEGPRGQSQFQIGHMLAWTRGSHSLQFGADYVRLAPSRRDASAAFSVIAGSLADLADRSIPWTANSPAQNAAAVVKQASVFAEDTWRAAGRLTLTFGARWEISPAPVGASFLDPAQNRAVPMPMPLWQSDYGNIAPRFGIAYRLTRDGRTILRAGGGLYFDSSLSLATDLINDGPLNISQYVNGRHGIFSTLLHFGFLPDLRLPLVTQWNVSLQRALSGRDVISLGYIGSSGSDLIRREIGGAGSTVTDWLAVATNRGASRYDGLQAQYRRRMGRGFQALASYAWSHSIDNSSTDAGLYWAGSGLSAGGDRASSDFDVRHLLTAGFTYDVPPGLRGAPWRGWTLDGMLQVRTGFPIAVLNAEEFTGLTLQNVFRPDLNGAQPVWIADPSAPGGRRIDAAAFQAAPNSAQGNLGRNAFNGFGMSQLDLALHREFFAAGRRSLQLRLEAFNALNHANFADPVRFLSSPLFGQSGSMLSYMLGTGSPGSGLAPMFQGGGARSLQLGLRFRF